MDVRLQGRAMPCCHRLRILPENQSLTLSTHAGREQLRSCRGCWAALTATVAPGGEDAASGGLNGSGDPACTWCRHDRAAFSSRSAGRCG